MGNYHKVSSEEFIFESDYIEIKNNGNNIVAKNGVKIISNKGIYRRQDAPKVYNISTACYIINSEYLMKVKNIYKSKVGLVQIPKERSIDIDDELDLFIANKIYEKKRIFSQ